MRPKFEDMWIFVIKQGGIAEASLDTINETIDSMINRSNFLVANWFRRGEMAEE
jgi:hypothetical protein